MQYVIVGAFILLDIFSGLLYALKSKNWTSTKMREGLFHKMALVLFIVMAILCDYGQNFLEIGYSIPISKTVCVYIILMEIGSFTENIIKINPQLTSKMKHFFNTPKDEIEINITNEVLKKDLGA